MKNAFILLAAFGFASAAIAKDRERIETAATFQETVVGRDLTMVGISVRVTRDGQIDGRAYGYDVSGKWQWKDGFFCRDLNWGGDELGPNCQAVYLEGKKVRFTSDRGAGRSAALRIN